MMKRITLTTLALLFAAPLMAETPGYSYAQLAWQSIEIDDTSVDGDGFSISGSMEIAEHWHLIAGYVDFGLDFGIDLEELAFGGGYHTDISPNTSAFFNAAWITADAGANGFASVDESGFGLSAGIRSYITETIELGGAINHTDLGNGLDGTSVSGSAWYSLTNNFAAGLMVEFDDDATVFGIGGRYYFGY